jgi:quercetin dioxygenase-like cupin family protein
MAKRQQKIVAETIHTAQANVRQKPSGRPISSMERLMLLLDTPVSSRAEVAMLDKTTTEFSHIKPGDTEFKGAGLRDFFVYRDLGIAQATHGKVIAHLVRANSAPEAGTGWHRHEADFHIVIMLKGWARFMYEDQETLVSAGDCVHQRPGITHFLFDYSPDMEYLEVVGPADFKTMDAPAPCAVPEPARWEEAAASPALP